MAMHGQLWLFEVLSTSAIVRDNSSTTTTGPRPGDGSCTNNTFKRLHLFGPDKIPVNPRLKLLRLHFFSLGCQQVNEPRSDNPVQGDDKRDSDPTFACCFACVAIPRQIQQQELDGAAERIKLNDLSASFLSLLIDSNRKTALKLVTAGLRDLQNTLVQ